MARYCCNRCGHPIQFSAVFSAFLPQLITCNQCGNHILETHNRMAWGVFALFGVLVISVGIYLSLEGLSVGFIAVALIAVSLTLEWGYFHALSYGWIGSALVPPGRVTHKIPPAALDHDGAVHLDIPSDWIVEEEGSGYRASSPDDSQCLYVKYFARNLHQAPEQWARDVSETLMATRYKPTVNHFVIMKEIVELKKEPYSVTVDGFDGHNGYRLVTQQMQAGKGMVSIGLHQFSCLNYKEALTDAAISLPLVINS